MAMLAAASPAVARPSQDALPPGHSRRDTAGLARPYLLDRRLVIIDEAIRRASSTAFSAGAFQDQAPVRTFDISAGPLVDAVRRFQAIAGVRLTMPEGLGAVHSPGVAGAYTPEQALALLLDGTGITFRFTEPGVAVLEYRLENAVDVTGRAPGETVSSTKYTQPLREIPQTIEVIPRATLEQQGVTTVSEALRNVSGITLQAGEGGGASNTAGDMFNMRGFNASNSIFVDGVRDDGLIARDVYNIEQVEVFMGPTGTDVGRGTAAGYVNLLTKTPNMRRTASAVVSVGSAEQVRTTIDVNQPLSAADNSSLLSGASLRLNALWQDNAVPGRDVAVLQSKAFAPSLSIGLGSPTRITLAGQMIRQDNAPDYGVPGAAWPGDLLTPTSVRAAAPVDQTNYFGSRDFDYDNAEQNSAIGRIEHDFAGGLTVRNQTRGSMAHREAVITSIANVAAFDPATQLVTLSRQGNDRENRIVSNQSSATGHFATGSLEHAANGGVEFASERQFAPALGGVGTRGPVSIYSPDPDAPVSAYAPARTGASTTGETSTAAIYGFDTIDLGSRWQVNGGLRWEYYTTSYRAVDVGGALITDEKSSDGIVSGKAGVLFRVNPRANVYASYGRTVTPPGTANFTLSAQANNQNNPNVDPQISRNIEAGIKWDSVDGRLSLTGAAFHTTNENVIFTVDATAIPPLYNQDDAQRVDGVTLGATGRILDRWTVLANFSYLDSASESQNPLTNGKRLTLTPKYSGSIWTTYTINRRLMLGGGVRATDEVFSNTANTIKAPGYWLVDGLAQYDVNSHFSLRLNVSNLTDELYIRNVNNNGGRYNPGAPRSVLLTSTIGF